jgi:carboxylesterase type B
MTGYWSNFAATGNPNKGPATPTLTWPQYDPVSDLNMQLQVPLNVTQHLMQNLCNMWDSVQNTLSQSVRAGL